MPARPMLAEELLQHPEYPHTIWDLKPTQKAKLQVAQGRGGPFSIAYEVHGHGDIHLVVRTLHFPTASPAGRSYCRASRPKTAHPTAPFVMPGRLQKCPQLLHYPANDLSSYPSLFRFSCIGRLSTSALVSPHCCPCLALFFLHVQHLVQTPPCNV